MPVQFATTSAMSSASTSSLRKTASRCSCCSSSVEPPLQLGDLAVAQLGGALQVGLALGPLDLAVGCLEALLDLADAR